MNVLGLSACYSTYDTADGESLVRGLEWVIDGQLLHEWLALRCWNEERSIVEGQSLGAATSSLRALVGQGTPDFDDGRVALLLCWCGDLECGALTATLGMTPDRVTWSDFAWQVPRDPGPNRDDGAEVVDAELVFERADYEALVDRVVSRLDETAVQPRRRWPWRDSSERWVNLRPWH